MPASFDYSRDSKTRKPARASSRSNTDGFAVLERARDGHFDAPKTACNDRTEALGFKYLLVTPDGEPEDPSGFATRGPNWSIGEEMNVGSGRQFRIVASARTLREKGVDQGINGMFGSRAR